MIAKGDRDGIDFLSHFYKKLEDSIAKVDPDANNSGNKSCPNCGKPMQIRKGRYGLFFGCTGYPECKTIESIKNKS